jgi:lipopolysaccharide/colanic/teichoic acid biosynthesis glycosyltransferase
MEQISIPKERVKGLASYTMESSASNKSTLSAGAAHEPSRLYYSSKRLIDIVLSAFGIIMLIPVFLIVAVCIKLDDGGDILYFREMVGLRGRPFFMLKFRTMISNADAYLQDQAELMQEFQQNMKLKQDPRVTRLGQFLRKTYLDELPQLFNVLVGQMSLVGPRSIHQRELALYGEYAEKRNSVKPGLTGLWQISRDRHRYYEERIPLDMQYIDTRSFTNDLVILLKTLKVFIAHRGV